MKIFSLIVLILFANTFGRQAAAKTSADKKADLTVATDGSGDVKTVQAAIDKAPENNRKRFVILVVSHNL
jgi:pectin methylesterase-like acyl-CoA thioesterase